MFRICLFILLCCKVIIFELVDYIVFWKLKVRVVISNRIVVFCLFRWCNVVYIDSWWLFSKVWFGN